MSLSTTRAMNYFLNFIALGFNSSNSLITCDVPKGTLFLISINDTCCLSSILKFILFADGTNLFHSSKSIDDLQHVVNHEMAAFLSGLKQTGYH